jgi:ABC-type polysaccharide/polyol phosphate export permease
MTNIIESTKLGFLGNGIASPGFMFYTYIASVLILFVGILLFNRREGDFIDSV